MKQKHCLKGLRIKGQNALLWCITGNVKWMYQVYSPCIYILYIYIYLPIYVGKKLWKGIKKSWSLQGAPSTTEEGRVVERLEKPPFTPHATSVGKVNTPSKYPSHLDTQDSPLCQSATGRWNTEIRTSHIYCGCHTAKLISWAPVTLCHSCCWYCKVFMLESVCPWALWKGLMLWSASKPVFCYRYPFLLACKFPLTLLC